MYQSTIESNVISYSNSFPVTFSHAKNATLITEDNEEYTDFFAGAGVLNFGHNNSAIKESIMNYLAEDTIIHGLDMSTTARNQYFDTVAEKILKPRHLDYKMMSCGPTGTNAIEAALKLARKYTNKKNILAFSRAFHGMSLGSLAATSAQFNREAAGVSLDNVTRVPYVDQFPSVKASLNFIKFLLSDDHSGVDKPAAIILETVQAEGGVNVAPKEWLQGIREICDQFNILMIVDDIQVGVGRTGSFFSFEEAGIVPDIVALSKSLSGFGLPLSVLFFKKELDIFEPAEHNGTFRGNQLGFVGSQAAIDYFVDNDLMEDVKSNEKIMQHELEKLLQLDPRIMVRGKGMIWGIDFSLIDPTITERVQQECFARNLIIESAGSQDAVLKLLPPLTIEKEQLEQGLNIIYSAVREVISGSQNDIL
ncbi:diaminobutyrate--2-oxoglutarate transaminase [Tetragenococcus osmophilus]|uniref:Diaminobutyrate--2-oxoglutarate transaminase n=1 Tax=Tetragenococcus osmophilus TaxID=526944 RepID=A0AA38CWT2_9ENTE|nr:diaminobutyrate--2-oxoglutarate transaminase [Tetragenococcus osmophilus]AYW48295.1 diaminobutyrate--2-oxoglutarate transaminase [Tetragenococcus osmophilus]GMA54102.1 diaminobutyrate--2-oxoglutarate transaminase [Alicyclobacillus contaminans]GMA72011.1 diaminobutyrate--2-oxoglutarate transaminase [Tetragenococcus osmophilus]